MNVISKIIDNKDTLRKLTKAFPAELQEDVKTVLTASPKTMAANYITHGVSVGGERQFCLNEKETVTLPYRLYYLDDIREGDFAKLTWIQQTVYHCIFSLSHDGYIREKHIKALLSQEKIPVWGFPFVLKNSGEYVVQILETTYQCLKGRDNTELIAFCRRNLQAFLYDYARMVSYWNEFYRYDYYRYKDYIGRKLYMECFGYTRSLEKYRAHSGGAARK